MTGLSIVGSEMTVSGDTKNVAWPYSPGLFEHPQSISGTAQLLGDIEYRGANQTETSGSFCGYVDDTISSNGTVTDVTAVPPYSWRDEPPDPGFFQISIARRDRIHSRIPCGPVREASRFGGTRRACP